MEHVRQPLNEGQAIDLFVAYRFLRILTTAWEDQEAYKLGIIDKDGKLLRKANTLKTAEEKKAFTLLHRLVFNLKRILHKIPAVRSKIGTYATALYLLKQHFENQVEEEDTIEKAFTGWLIDNGYLTQEELEEAYQQSAASKKFQDQMKRHKPVIGRPPEPELLSKFLPRAKKAGYKAKPVEEFEIDEAVIGIGQTLPKGSYRLTQDIFAGNQGDIRGKAGDIVVAFAETAPTDSVMGQNIFKVVHQKSKEEIYVALEDLKDK